MLAGEKQMAAIHWDRRHFHTHLAIGFSSSSQ
jgi:hypothetical protein